MLRGNICFIYAELKRFCVTLCILALFLFAQMEMPTTKDQNSITESQEGTLIAVLLSLKGQQLWRNNLRQKLVCRKRLTPVSDTGKTKTKEVLLGVTENNQNVLRGIQKLWFRGIKITASVWYIQGKFLSGSLFWGDISDEREEIF